MRTFSKLNEIYMARERMNQAKVCELTVIKETGINTGVARGIKTVGHSKGHSEISQTG